MCVLIYFYMYQEGEKMDKWIKVLVFIWSVLFGLPYAVIQLSGYTPNANFNQKLLETKNLKGNIKEGTNQQNTHSLIEDREIISALAKSVPYTYEIDTIRAQAIIIRTYLARRKLNIEEEGELEKYSEEELREIWAENYDKIYAIYNEAVTDTKDLVIYYNNELIEPVYHNASGGSTRDSLDVYDVDIPYLKSVKSTQDTIVKQSEFEKEDLVLLLTSKYPDIIVDAKRIENQIQIIERDKSDYIKQIQVGNVIIKGEEFRKLLGLQSSNFKIVLSDDKLIFVTKGIGHGVGFSQNGANEMVKAGKNYEEILKYYYQDIAIKKIGE